MNSKQERAVEKIRAAIIEKHARGNEREFKQFEITELADGELISLVVEYGMVGDEGTYAEIMVREYWHFFIGIAGGVTLVSHSTNLNSHNSSGKNGLARGVYNSVNFYRKAAA